MEDVEDAVASLKSNSFVFKLAERGFSMVEKRTASGARRQWEYDGGEKGRFQYRAAYVSRRVPLGEREKVIRAAMRMRPIDFKKAKLVTGPTPIRPETE